MKLNLEFWVQVWQSLCQWFKPAKSTSSLENCNLLALNTIPFIEQCVRNSHVWMDDDLIYLLNNKVSSTHLVLSCQIFQYRRLQLPCTSEDRVDHIFKSCLFFQSKLLIPLYYVRTDTNKNFRPIGVGLGVPQALHGNGHKIGHKFNLAITFYGMQ